ncbi:MAG: 3-deoxy-7-phosphoheptulonate synthase [Kiritimatiellia bacterium]
MIIVMKPTATQADVQTICDWISSLRYQPRVTTGAEQTVIACIGSEVNPQTVAQLETLETVQEIIHVSKKYKLVSRDFKKEDTIIDIKGTKIGGGNIPIMAGPCAVESYDQFHAVVADLVALNIHVIRAMVYKPRTSTYDFQGLKEEGIRVMREVKKDFPMVAFITEVPGPNQIEGLMDVTDVFQVGARNSQNYDLLEYLGKAGKPIILKRGIAGTVEEWLQSAEYLMANGCNDVILCERGIRTYETITRNCLDLGALAATKRLTHLPIVADPSHGGGKLELVVPLSRAALGAGCDGLLVETHPDPKHAFSDAAQQIPSATFGEYLKAIAPWHDLAVAVRK